MSIADGRSEQVRRAMQKAKDIIDQEYIAAGATREELDKDETVFCLFRELVASGRNIDELLAEWQNKTHDEILREYTRVVPQAAFSESSR